MGHEPPTQPTTPSNSADGRLAERVAGGDHDAMREVFDEYFGLVFQICRRICPQIVDAQEVTEHVFVEFWNSPKRYHPGRGSLRTYLGLLARSRSKDHVRSLSVRGRHHNEAAELRWEDSSHGQQTPLDQMTRDEQRGEIRAVLATLPEEFQTVLALAFYEAKSHREIAEALDIPLGTVKSRVRRGLLRIREKLQHWEQERES